MEPKIIRLPSNGPKEGTHLDRYLANRDSHDRRAQRRAKAKKTSPDKTDD